MKDYKNIYFISGHGNITFEEWLINYKPFIDAALKQNSQFILGDFRGTDTLSAEYLKDKTPHVKIIHCFQRPRYKVDTVNLASKYWEYIGGFENDTERDAYMTQNSDYDIAWIRKGKENSGTAKNIQRRNKI